MAKRPTPAKRTPERSAGILLFREAPDGLRVLLAHPGGPFFAKRDAGAWTIPKGLIEPDEPPAEAARREFAEELGWRPDGVLIPLGDVRLRSGKIVTGFGLKSTEPEAEALARFNPGVFTMEWPPRSGRHTEFPEVDRCAYFPLTEAAQRLNPAQVPFLTRLAAEIAGAAPDSPVS